MDVYINTLRRFWLLSKIEASRRLEFAIAAVHLGKQQELPGTALPATFPYLSQLSAAGYTTKEDINGADQTELMENVGLGPIQANAVLSALAALP